MPKPITRSSGRRGGVVETTPGIVDLDAPDNDPNPVAIEIRLDQGGFGGGGGITVGAMDDFDDFDDGVMTEARRQDAERTMRDDADHFRITGENIMTPPQRADVVVGNRRGDAREAPLSSRAREEFNERQKTVDERVAEEERAAYKEAEANFESHYKNSIMSLDLDLDLD